MATKKKRIVPGVTTQEALENCLLEQASVFCIENPLYSRVVDSLSKDRRFSDYLAEIFPQKQVILMRKVKGQNILEEDQLELMYIPLQWDGWHS